MKNKLKGKVTLINIITSILLQMVTIISGLIIPKLILESFGSEANGLVSSINQFLSYITLAEGGFTSVIYANLYKPLVEKNTEKINKILRTAKNFYVKIGIIFIIYAIVLSIIYPIIVQSNFSFIYVFSLILILSSQLFVQYMFSLTMKTLLVADKKQYVVSILSIIIGILHIIITIILIKIFPSIHIIKIASLLLFLIQPIFYNFYTKKHYKLDLNVKGDNNLIKQRWDGLAVYIASFVNRSVDITLLSIFSTLSNVSIYNIYNLAVQSIANLITSFTVDINSSLGHTYVKGNIKEINERLSIYEYIINIICFYFYTVCGLLLTPFVLIYTIKVTDANYNQELFGVLLVISAIIKTIRLPHSNLTFVANKYKEMKIPSIIEAVLNIIVSFILLKLFGIVGVIIGTIVAMTYKTIFNVYFVKKMIGRKQWIFYKKILIFTMGSLIGIIICRFIISPLDTNLVNWLVHAIVYCIVFGIIFAIISVLFFRNDLKFFVKYLKIKK